MSTSLPDEPVTLPPLRMRAYWFAFAETGVRCIDEILSAVACAGKGYHNTEHWAEAGYTQQMQDAAVRAAAEIERLQKELRAYRQGFEGALRYVSEDIYDDVRAPFDPKRSGFTPDYANDLASMRAARALLP